MKRTCCFAFGIVAIWWMVAGHRPTAAGEFNTVRNIGDAAPSWADLPTTDGGSSSLDDFAKVKVVVLAFTCNSCPYAIDVESRLIELANRYNKSSVAIVAVNVNTIEEDAMPAMKVKAKEKSFPFPYAFDESQQIAKDYGAKYTPEFFVLDRERHIAYMGSFDDSPDGRNVTQPHVQNAIDAVLSGEAIGVTETVPVGCRIRMERQRRSRPIQP